MEEKELTTEEIEKVSGGYDESKLDENESEHLKYLRNRVHKAHQMARGNRELKRVFNKALKDLREYEQELQNKYDAAE